ncbi:MAG TPA: bifunctional oligoribonuclease/PAP phosphatase NrnA [Candidatus Kapabacteria bacterium]|jgi:phosphoesterase RecJ-like protein|nr:bifunctional oligoribonuclease/PAP phosphatase NrnA [Candidatus Kapabacteria bacterium]
MRFVEIADVAGLFEGCGSIVISSHVNPDGDACGSSLAMYQVLVGLGKDVRVIFTSSVPSNMRFLPGAEFVELYDGSVHDDVIVGSDLLLVLDCNAPSRLMRMEGVVLRREKPILVVDHHESPAEFADFYRVDVDSSSTCELVWEIGSFLESRGFGVLSKDFAVCCYTGIMTDTGGFRFPRTDAALHRAVARLIELGADPVMIADSVLNDGSVSRLVLLGRALSSMRLFVGGGVCVMSVRREWFVETGTGLDDIEGFVNHCLSVRGVVLGLLFVEHPFEGIVKVSMRSRGDVEARRLAVEFGGGGHFHAAAARLVDGGLDVVIGEVLERVVVLGLVV